MSKESVMVDERESPGPRRFGTDQVVLKENQVVVYAPAEMPGWEVRKFRRAGIRFEGRLYFVSRISRQQEDRIRYVLDTWPADSPEDPAFEITYDEEYVQMRDRNTRAGRRGRRAEPLIFLLMPFIGLLASRVKARLHDQYGIDARSATEASLWAECLLVVVGSALLLPLVIAGSILPLLIFPAIVLAVPDLVMRFMEFLRDPMAPPGFYEWLFRLRKR